jgi:hypothetical protein
MTSVLAVRVVYDDHADGIMQPEAFFRKENELKTN